jgi:hypothetical protein
MKTRPQVEIFDKATFEAALPQKKDGSGPAWVYGGSWLGLSAFHFQRLKARIKRKVSLKFVQLSTGYHACLIARANDPPRHHTDR